MLPPPGQITMLRGAQSGGVCTYLPDDRGLKGSRSRVVNRKRTDLSQLLIRQLRADMARRSLMRGPLQSPSIFQGNLDVTLESATEPFFPTSAYEHRSSEFQDPRV